MVVEGVLVRRLKGGRIECQGVQRSELGEGRRGAETLKGGGKRRC